MIKKNFLYFITIFFLFFKADNVLSVIDNSVIIAVGKEPITRLDLFKEIKLIAILSGGQITEENKDRIKDLAIKSLIKKSIKNIEIQKRNVKKYNKKDLENIINNTARNLGLDKSGLQELLERNNLSYKNLEEKFVIDLKWNTMIFEIYKNRISLNTVEIENKLNAQLKNLEDKDRVEEKIEALKKEIVNDEKNKKLRMFSNSHYSNLERVIQIKFL